MYVTKTGEVAIAYKCTQKKTKISVMNEKKFCCQELSVKTHDLSGDNSISMFMEPAIQCLKDICVMKICTKDFLPGFNIDSNTEKSRIVVVKPDGKLSQPNIQLNFGPKE